MFQLNLKGIIGVNCRPKNTTVKGTLIRKRIFYNHIFFSHYSMETVTVEIQSGKNIKSEFKKSKNLQCLHYRWREFQNKWSSKPAFPNIFSNSKHHRWSKIMEWKIKNELFTLICAFEAPQSTSFGREFFVWNLKNGFSFKVLQLLRSPCPLRSDCRSARRGRRCQR